MHRRFVPTFVVATVALAAGVVGAQSRSTSDAGASAPRTSGTPAASHADAGASGAGHAVSTEVNPHDATLLLEPNPAPATLRVALPGLAAGALPQESAFNGMGCTGQNRSPHITWSGAPRTARSYAVIVHDPDAPTGVGFFHWTIYNLPANTTQLAAGAAVPAGAVQGPTDFGAPGYGGPCPPNGETHRYVVTVYALDVPRLDVPATASGAYLRFALRAHTVALGRAIGTYHRP